MAEKLIIDNFAGIKHIELDIGKINILIGPQATGKSICAKLHYYFNNFGLTFTTSALKQSSKVLVDNGLKKQFKEFFPVSTWSNENFLIRYENNTNWIQIERVSVRSSKIRLTYSESLKRAYNLAKKQVKELFIEGNLELKASTYYKEELEMPSSINMSEIFNNKDIMSVITSLSDTSNIFIPSGRSFFLLLQSNIFSFLSTTSSLDPFIVEFGKHYESFRFEEEDYSEFTSYKKKIHKRIKNDITNLLEGKLIREKDRDFLLQNYNRKVDISYSSSGQQEMLPLLIALKSIYYRQEKNNLERIIYIEEPEAHIFPEAQKKVVELISTVFNGSPDKLCIFITTHSPYILTAFNNLMQAGSLEKTLPEEKKKELYAIIPKEKVLNPDCVKAYSLSNGKCNSIIDEDTSLINDNVIDEVSDEIAIEFGNLLELERE
ncbi:MAG: AAA family ATPase [Candidatus Hatepunaea meridiana]|nr:AAA family ATPase [Candidatus Hatepunaea meridiana]